MVLGTISEIETFSGGGPDWSNVLALMAIIISIITAFLEWRRWRKDKKTGLEMEYYKTVFDEFLLEMIPQEREFVAYTVENRLDRKYKDFGKCLSDLKKKALFFKYHNLEFYRLLCSRLEELDEMLVIEAGKKNVGKEEQIKFLFKLDGRIRDLYEVIFNNCLM